MELNNQFINSVQPPVAKFRPHRCLITAQVRQVNSNRLWIRQSLVEMDSKSPVNLPNGPLKIKFSNHAVERMRSRGLTYTPDMLQKD